MKPQEIICPGLPACWINGWLAAVGATVLDQRIRLHWTNDGNPKAILSSPKTDVVDALIESWPSSELLADLPIAEQWKDTDLCKRHVPVDVFVQRASKARMHPYSWALSSTMTDLCVDKNGEVEHAPFDAPGPGTIKWLHHRLVKLQQSKYINPLETQLHESLMGYAVRVNNNGLGFDCSRLGSSSDVTPVFIDPIVETLAFFGLKMFPVRGDGVDQRLDQHVKTGKRQRGWRSSTSGQGNLRFLWPAWSEPLDYAAIDALMDIWNPFPRLKSTWKKLGIHAGWQSVKYNPTASADTTRAFGSEQL